MASLIKGTKCKSCGASHDLYFGEDEPIGRNGRYVFTCPETGEESWYRRGGTDPVKTDRCPPGAISLTRHHRPL
jgi:hypothetical protein